MGLTLNFYMNESKPERAIAIIFNEGKHNLFKRIIHRGTIKA